EVIGRLLLLGIARDDAMPRATIGVADLIQLVFLPLAGNWIEGLRCAGHAGRSHLALHLRCFRILGERRQVPPGRLHCRTAGEEQIPALAERPAYLLARTSVREFQVILQSSKMPLR